VLSDAAYQISLIINHRETSKANSSTFSPSLGGRETERERDCWSQGDYSKAPIISISYSCSTRIFRCWVLFSIHSLHSFRLQPPLSIEFRSDSELVCFNILNFPHFSLRFLDTHFEFLSFLFMLMIILCIFVYNLQYPIHCWGILSLFSFFVLFSEMSCHWFLHMSFIIFVVVYLNFVLCFVFCFFDVFLFLKWDFVDWVFWVWLVWILS
jgi:hypothetical protein